MNRKKYIFSRLDKQIAEIGRTLDTLSKQLYAASNLFQELQIQEDTLEKKLSFGINWKSELERIRVSSVSRPTSNSDPSDFRNRSPSQAHKETKSAYKFGVDLFKQWSLFATANKLSLQSEISHLIQATSDSFYKFDSKILKNQEYVNEDFVYQYKTFNDERTYLVKKKPVADWKMHPHWTGCTPVVNSLKQNERWPLDLVMFDKSRKFWHYRDFFRTSNNFTFFQVENLRLLLNTSFYKSFRRFKAETKDNLHLLTRFPS